MAIQQTKALSYAKNLTKSISYSVIDEIKNSNPAITGFAETNKDVMKSAYNAITHVKKTYSSLTDQIVNSKVGELGTQALQNVKEDLRSGKWYNLERKTKADDAAMEAAGWGDDDDDFGFEAMANGEFDFGDDDESLESMVDLVGQKASTAISEAVIQSTEQSINVQSKLAKASADQQQAIYANLHAGMGTINENIGKLIEIANGPITTHMENSKTFYESETSLSKERNDILKNILDIQKSIYRREERQQNSKITMNSIIDEKGMPDLELYFEKIMKNINDRSNGMGDMLKEYLEGGMFDSLISSPLEYVTGAVAKVLVPNVLKSTMKEFNKSIGGFFGSAMSKIMNSDSDNPMINFIRNVFGVDESVKTNINVASYEKGAVPFDGITRKSIIEVIPTYLARIESAVMHMSGVSADDLRKYERRYNYETGQYVNVKDIRKSFKSIKNSEKDRANRDVNSHLNKFMNMIDFGDNKNRKKELQKNIDRIMTQSFDTGVLFNPKEIDKFASDYNLKGDHADEDLELIRKMFELVPRDVMMNYANNVYSAKNGITREMERRQSLGHDISNALFNGSLGSRKSKKKNKSSEVKANTNTNNSSSESNESQNNRGKNDNSSDDDSDGDGDGDPSSGYLENTQANKNDINKESETLEEEVNKKGKKKKNGEDNNNDENNNASLTGKLRSFVKNATKDHREGKSKDDETDEDEIQKIAFDENLDSETMAQMVFDALNEIEEKEKSKNKKKKSKIREKLDEAAKSSSGVTKLVTNIEKLIKKPTDFLAGVIKKADNAMYELIFGVEYDEDGERKSVSKAIFDGLREQFTELREWTQRLFNPVREYFNKEGTLGNKAVTAVKKQLKNAKDSEFMQTIRDAFGFTKKTVKDAGKAVKDTIKKDLAEDPDQLNKVEDLINEINKRDENKESNTLEEEVNKKGKKKNVKGTGDTEPVNSDNIDNAASGMKRVTKTGVIAVSEGEMIVPPDLNPHNIKVRERNENRAKKQFANSLADKIKGFAAGGIVPGEDFYDSIYDSYYDNDEDSNAVPNDYINQMNDDTESYESTAEWRWKNKSKEDITDKLTNMFKTDFKSALKEYEKLDKADKKTVLDALKSTGAEELVDILKQEITRNLFHSNIIRLVDNAKDAYNRGKDRADQEKEENKKDGEDKKGVLDKFLNGKMNKEQQKLVDDAMSDVKNHLPQAAAGATIGGGLSFLTGAIGGPLVGAAVGSSIALIKNSESISRMLFGEKLTDQYGNVIGRKGNGLLTKDLTDNIHKYGPNMGKGAILGAITSLLPITPFGPLTGAFLGSAIGFATNSETIRDRLFGDEGLLGKDFDKKVERALPNVGAGAAIGLLTAPFGGPVANLILGSAAGFATSTDKFKDILFGEIDEAKYGDKNRHGGIIEIAVHGLFKPISDFTKDTINNLMDWADKNIKQPLKDAAKPIKKQIKLMFEGIHKGINSLFKESLGATFDDMLRDYIFKPLTGFVKKITGAALAPIKAVVSAPFKLVGAVGNKLRDRQVKRGNADYMSADERIAYREKRGLLRSNIAMPWNIATNDRFKKYDEALSQMSGSQAGDLASQLEMTLDSKKALEKSTKSAHAKFTKNVRKNKKLTAQDVNAIAEKLTDYVQKRKGSPERAAKQAHDYIDKLDGLNDAEKEEIKASVDEYIGSMKDFYTRKDQFGGNVEAIKEALKNTDQFKNAGIKDIKDSDLPKLYEYLMSESKHKTVGQNNEETTEEGVANEQGQKERHEETIDKLKEINDNLKRLVNQNNERSESYADQLSDVEDYDKLLKDFISFKKIRRTGTKFAIEAPRAIINSLVAAGKIPIDVANAIDDGVLDGAGKDAIHSLFGNKDIDYQNITRDERLKQTEDNKSRNKRSRDNRTEEFDKNSSDTNDRYKRYDEALSQMNESQADDIASQLQNAASGGRFTKDSLAAVSKGEIIIPSNIAEGIPNFAGGGAVGGADDVTMHVFVDQMSNEVYSKFVDMLCEDNGGGNTSYNTLLSRIADTTAALVKGIPLIGEVPGLEDLIDMTADIVKTSKINQDMIEQGGTLKWIKNGVGKLLHRDNGDDDGEIGAAASGAKFAKDSLAVASKGEYILSPDLGDKFEKEFESSISNFAQGGIVGEGEVDENNTSENIPSLFDKIRQKAANKIDKVRYEFSNGRPFKYIKDNAGEWILDRSDSETINSLNKVEEEAQEKKSLFKSLTEMPHNFIDGIKRVFNGDEDAEDRKNKKGLFGKLFNVLGGGKNPMKGIIGTSIASIVGIPILTGLLAKFFGNTEIGQTIKGGLDNLVKNLNLGENLGDLGGNIVGGITDWLRGKEGSLGGGLPGLISAALEHWAAGFEYIATEIVPKAVEILVAALPGVLLGAFKGLGRIIGINFHNSIHGGEGSNNLMQEDKNASSKSKIVIGKMTSKNGSHKMKYNPNSTGPSSFSDWSTIAGQGDSKGSVSIDWSELTSGYNISDTVKNVTDQGFVDRANDKYDQGISEGTIKNYKDTESYNSLSEGMRAKLDKQLQTLEKDGKNVVQINTGTAENPKYEYKTLQELLTMDNIELGQGVDENGNPITLSGEDVLNNPTLGKSLGLDWQLTDEERQANKEANGHAKNSSLAMNTLKVSAKKALTRNGQHTMFRTMGNVAKHIPIVGKIAAPALYLADSTATAAGKFGNWAAEKISKKAAGEGIESAAKGAMKKESKGLIRKITKWVTTHIGKLGECAPVLKCIKKGLKQAGKACSKEAVEAVVQKIIKTIEQKAFPKLFSALAKTSVKALGKIAATFASGGIMKLIFSGKAFLDGIANAESIIGVIADNDLVDYDPSLTTKLLCGIAGFLNEFFFWGLVPMDTLFNILYEPAKEIFDIDPEKTKELDEARTLSQKVLKEQNIEADENMTIWEYNDKDKLSTKIKNGIGNFVFGKKNKETGEREGGIVENTKNFFSGLDKKLFGDKTKKVSQEEILAYKESMDMTEEAKLSLYNRHQSEKVSKDEYAEKKALFIQQNPDKEASFEDIIEFDNDRQKGIFGGITGHTVTDAVSNAGKTIGDIAGKAGKAIGNAAGKAFDIGKDITGIVAQAMGYATYKLDKKASDAIKEEKDNPLGGFSKFLAGTMDTLFSPLRGAFTIGRGIGKIASTIAEFGVRFAKQVHNDAAQGEKDFNKGDFKSYFTLAHTEVDADGNEVHNPLSPFRTFIKGTTRILNLPVLGVKWIGKQIADSIGKVINGAKVVFDLVTKSIGTTIEIAKTGSVGEYFNFENGTVETPFSWLNTALTGVTRITMLPIAGVISAGVAIKDAIGTVINGIKTTVKSIGSNVSQTIDIAKNGTIKEYFDFTNGKSKDMPFDWLNVAITGVTRVVMAVPAAMISVGTKIGDFVGDLISSGKTMFVDIAKDQSYTSGYLDKDNLDGYWDKKNIKSTGFFGTVASVIGTVNRALMMPVVIITQLVKKIGGFIEKPIEWVKEKLGNFADGIAEFFGMKSDKDGKNSKGETNALGDGGSGSGIDSNLQKVHARGSKPKSDPKFKNDSSFISQIDSRYANKSFNVSGDSKKQTIADTGCGPAAAAMVVNNAVHSNVLDMKDAAKDALKYKVKDGGVNAAYFENEFTKHGLSTRYITDEDSKQKNQNILNSLYSGNRTVLMGKDASNRSKANSPYGPNDHYIVATRASRDGKYIWVNDPESKVPEVRYPASVVLNKTKMGVAGVAANGSGLLKYLHAKGTGIKNIKNYNACGTYGPDTIEYKVWNGLRAAGYDEIHTAAIMGNIYQESKFDPSAIEAGSGAGFGLVQWTGPRRTAIENYASSIGKSANDLTGVQIPFLVAEMTPGGGCNGFATYQFMKQTKAGQVWGEDSFKNATDLDTATRAFCWTFERCSERYAMMDVRLEWAKKFYEAFTGSTIDVSISSSDVSTGSNLSSSGNSNSSGGTILDAIFSAIGNFAKAFGLSSISNNSSVSNSSSTSGTIAGAVSDKQIALVEKMKSIQGQIDYSQDGPRNPDLGSADCSSTVQWAYKSVLGEEGDPGDWSGAYSSSPNTYTVTDKLDPSVMQPGDAIVYDGHISMYAGDGQMIEHGGPGKGPEMHPLSEKNGRFRMVRRWNGFKDQEPDSTVSNETTNDNEDISAAEASGSGLLRTINAKGTGLNPNKDISLSDTMMTSNESHGDKQGFLRKSRYDKSLKKNMKVNASYYAAGTELDKSVNKVPTTSMEFLSKNNKNKNDNKMIAYMNAILKLLSKEVENTSMLSTVVTILTELVKVYEEERNITGSSSKEIQQKKDALESKRMSMLNILNATGIQSGSQNNDLTKLIKDAERLARI